MESYSQPCTTDPTLRNQYVGAAGLVASLESENTFSLAPGTFRLSPDPGALLGPALLRSWAKKPWKAPLTCAFSQTGVGRGLTIHPTGSKGTAGQPLPG